MNTDDLQQLAKVADPCTCPLCSRSRKFATIVERLDDDSDREWMMGFLDYVVNLEETNGMLEMERVQQ